MVINKNGMKEDRHKSGILFLAKRARKNVVKVCFVFSLEKGKNTNA
jgi:hypothetical protein